MELNLNKKDFINALKVAVSTCGKNDVRYYLNGVCLDLERADVVSIVGTDGHAIGRVVLNVEHGENCKFIIARASVEQLIKATTLSRIDTEEIGIVVDVNTKSMVAIDNGNVTQLTLIDGNYPDYMRVLQLEPMPTATAIHAPLQQINSMSRALAHVTAKLGGLKSVRISTEYSNGLIACTPCALLSCGTIESAMIGIMPSRV